MGDKVDKMEVDQPPPPPPPPQLVEVPVSATPPPYDLAALRWNSIHTQNEQHQYCYCGGDRTLTEISLQCDGCKNWFHAKCIQCPLDHVHPFITNYTFSCKWCTKGAPETFVRTNVPWIYILQCVLANLSLMHPQLTWFTVKEHIAAYVDKQWDYVCANRERTPSWYATVGSSMSNTTTDIIMCKDDRRSSTSPYALKDPDLLNICPIAQKSSSATKRTNEGADGSPVPTEAESTQRSERSRSSRDSSGSSSKRRKSESVPKVAEKSATTLQQAITGKRVTIIPVDNPFNRDGYRYTLAEQDGIVKDVEEPLWREAFPRSGLAMSMEDRAQSINLSRDGLHAWSEKGLRLARSSHGVRAGTWYWEVTVEEPVSQQPQQYQPGTQPNLQQANGVSTSSSASAPASASAMAASLLSAAAGSAASSGATEPKVLDGPHVRIGWARRGATLEAPVGFDEYGYCYRDKTGQKVHKSTPIDYGQPFTIGDTIGVLIHLPTHPVGGLANLPLPVDLPRHVSLPKTRLTRIPIKFKGSVFFEDKDVVDANAPVLKGSYIEFFKNGVSQGPAFQDIPQSDYYAAVSLFRGAQVFTNFGQSPFKYPPAAPPYQPLDECFFVHVAESVLIDIADNVCFGVTAPNRPATTEL